jgi:hypothetical protein
MSSTTRFRLSVEPGTADVIPVPKITAQADPGGVIWTTRNSGPAEKSASTRQPSP